MSKESPQRIWSTIYVGGPDGWRVAQAIHVIATTQDGIEARITPCLEGGPLEIHLDCRRQRARELTRLARRVARNAHAHCRVVEDPAA